MRLGPEIEAARNQAAIANSWHKSLLARMVGVRAAIDAAVLQSDAHAVRQLRAQLEHMKREASAAAADVAGFRRIAKRLAG